MNNDIVFIGLGQMGLPMACNLARAGFAVQGFDLVRDNMARLVERGARAVQDLDAALAAADTVVTMLPADAHVQAAYLGKGGIVERANPGSLLIDCTTVSPATARKVAGAAAARGLQMIDCPVSGGIGGATAGTLTFMIGGEATHVERARKVLEKMGKAIFHAGPSGAGVTVKLCNNMLLGIQMLGTCEALQLGLANGLDLRVLSDVMSRSTGRNWVLEQYNPCPGVMDTAPASRDYAGGFAVDLMRKDLRLALENGCASGALTPLGALARSLFDLHAKGGAGGLDFSSVFRLLAPQR